MSDNILMDNILNYIRKFAIKADNYKRFRSSIEEDYSQKIGQEVVLMMGLTPRYILNGEKYFTYSMKVKIGDD